MKLFLLCFVTLTLASSLPALAEQGHHPYHHHHHQDNDDQSVEEDDSDLCGTSEFDAYSTSDDLSTVEGGPGWITFSTQKEFDDLDGAGIVQIYVHCSGASAHATGLVNKIETEKNDTVYYRDGAALIDITPTNGKTRTHWSSVACTLARSLPKDSLMLVPHFEEEDPDADGSTIVTNQSSVNRGYLVRTYGVRIFPVSDVLKGCAK